MPKKLGYPKKTLNESDTRLILEVKKEQNSALDLSRQKTLNIGNKRMMYWRKSVAYFLPPTP